MIGWLVNLFRHSVPPPVADPAAVDLQRRVDRLTSRSTHAVDAANAAMDRELREALEAMVGDQRGRS